MFTLKHVTKDINGSTSNAEKETLYSQVKQVHKLVLEESTSKYVAVKFIDCDKTLITLHVGIIYVMNENGKTVATYDLT